MIDSGKHKPKKVQDPGNLKRQGREAVDRLSEPLISLSRQIFNTPELSLVEHEAVRLIARTMQYEAMQLNFLREKVFLENFEPFRFDVKRAPEQGMGSTEKGYASLRVSMLHGYVAIDPEGVKPHTEEFTKNSSLLKQGSDQ